MLEEPDVKRTSGAPSDELASRRSTLALGLVVVNDSRCRGIGDWDVVVAVQLIHAAGQRSAHCHPIKKFDSLRTRKLYQIVNRIPGQGFWFCHDFVEAQRVEFLIDEACA